MSIHTNTTLILDNGGHTIKAGLSTSPVSNHRKIYNAAIRSKGDKRLYIGHEFEKCKDYASLHYRLSFEKGYLIDWDVQKAVWDGLFGREALSIDLRSTSILITEPPFNLHNIQEKYDQLVFEEYEFANYVRSPAASLLPYGRLYSPNSPPSTSSCPECFLVVDSGFSFTHVIPVMQGGILWNGVRRVDIGGKLLTNHLSTLVSFRQWNMLDQTHIVNDIKEKCCYVSSSFSRDLELSRSGASSGLTLEYVLPDFSRNRHGHVRNHTSPAVSAEANALEAGQSNVSHDESSSPGSEQILYMRNERFSVPELLFKPSDIGLEQSGVSEAIAHSIASLPHELQGMFWANISLVGGNVKFPGFKNRLCQDLRSLAPVEYQVGVYEAEDPIMETYISGHAFANSDAFNSLAVTREEYHEGGSNACRRKFRKFDWDPIKEKMDDGARTLRRERDKAKYRVSDESDGEKSAEDTKRGPARRVPVKKGEKLTNAPRRESSRAK